MTDNRATHTEPARSQPEQTPRAADSALPRPTKEDVIQNILHDARMSAGDYLRKTRVLYGGG